jgi:peptidoglycan/xylan/chitin deacetylase (PgdA/CDA1 family)
VKKKITLPKKSVLITFDDGYKSTIELAYPILKNYKFKATSFIITSRIDREYMVSESDLMSTQDVYSYQNHTDTFHMFNSLTNLSLLQSESRLLIYNDIVKSNTILESLVDHTVTSHAYPYGKYSPQALLAIKDAGITSAFTIDEGNVSQGDNLYALNRQRVHSNMSLTDFARRLEGK